MKAPSSMGRRAVFGLIAVAAALVVAGPAAADRRLAHESGVFAYVVPDDWAVDPDGDGFAVKCDGGACGDTGAWCEAVFSPEVENQARDEFFNGSPKDVDAKVRSSAGVDAKYTPVTPMARRALGAKDGFYGEYDLAIKGEQTLKTVVFHTFNKRRLIVLRCVSDKQRLQMIRDIVDKSELPS